MLHRAIQLAAPDSFLTFPPPPSANRTMPKGYYKEVDGVNYDRKLLEKAQRLARENAGTLSKDAVEKLWVDVRSDGRNRGHEDGVWDVELRTLLHIADTLKLDKSAAALMKKETAVHEASAGGSGSGADSSSGAGKRSRGSVERFEAGPASGKAAGSGSGSGSGSGKRKKSGSSDDYYQIIDGVKYDRALLELAEELSSGGKLERGGGRAAARGRRRTAAR